MKPIKYFISLILILVTLAITLIGCGSKIDIEVELGEQFALSIGDTVGVKGEQLEITFVEILEDSRCPSDVTCVWEGRVRFHLDVSLQGTYYLVVLTQPGLSHEYESDSFQDYKLSFKVEPYPLSELTLSAKDYYIYFTITNN